MSHSTSSAGSRARHKNTFSVLVALFAIPTTAAIAQQSVLLPPSTQRTPASIEVAGTLVTQEWPPAYTPPVYAPPARRANGPAFDGRLLDGALVEFPPVFGSSISVSPPAMTRATAGMTGNVETGNSGPPSQGSHSSYPPAFRVGEATGMTHLPVPQRGKYSPRATTLRSPSTHQSHSAQQPSNQQPSNGQSQAESIFRLLQHLPPVTSDGDDEVSFEFPTDITLQPPLQLNPPVGSYRVADAASTSETTGLVELPTHDNASVRETSPEPNRAPQTERINSGQTTFENLELENEQPEIKNSLTENSAKETPQTIVSETTASTPPITNQPTVAGGLDGFGSLGATECGDGCGCVRCVSPFSPDPNYDNAPFDPAWEWDVYDGKWFNCKQSPWIEWGRGIYKPGPVPRSQYFFGEKNPISQSFLLYGDYRTAVAYNDVGTSDKAVWAHRLNLDFDYKITATERLHAFWGPLDRANRFTRIEANDDQFTFTDEFDGDFDTLFFEGDLGYIWGGFTDQYAPFDLPFAMGRFPLFFQNGVWFNETIEGFAFTIPTRHKRIPVISNYEITYFFGFDDVASPAFGNDDNVANIYGAHGFFEMLEGYLEVGHAFLDDTTDRGLSYHNFGASFSRRYGHRVSNAVRLLVSTGQSPRGGAPKTADGALLLFENAWISRNPNFFVPYFNMFAGFGRPQSASRAVNNVLVNTGINFETDALTGYPALDASGNDTWGGAMGLNWMGPDFSWQWIVELAMLQTFGDQATRNVAGDQYAIGTRYQIPINYSWILRMDAMYGIQDAADDLVGGRMELRWKF